MGAGVTGISPKRAVFGLGVPNAPRLLASGCLLPRGGASCPGWALLAYTSYRSGPRGKLLPGLLDAGWRQLIAASAPAAVTFPNYALDNGAWAAYTNDIPWDPAPFVKLVDDIGQNADWIAAPDIVGGGAESLALSLSWLERLPGLVLIPVQDGMAPEDVSPHLGPRLGIFVGGTTEWKLQTARHWGKLARHKGCWLHIARVNTPKRIRVCQDVGATSFDGNSPLMFPSTQRKINAARSQGHLFPEGIK